MSFVKFDHIVKKSGLAAIAGLTLLMSGCGTIAHRCPIDGGGGPECQSMYQAYDTAVKMPDMAMSDPMPVYAAGSTYGKQASPGNFPQSRQAGMPVYEPAKVHRAWTAPWTDADGYLHGGEYVYFTTPGSWAYGGLKTPGDASDIFRPRSPDDVNAELASPLKNMTDTVKAMPVPAPQGAHAASQSSAPVAVPGGITQPYQKLTTSEAPNK